MGLPRDGPRSVAGLEGTVKHRQVFGFQPGSPLDGVFAVDVGHDGPHFLRGVAQRLEGVRDGAVDDLHHPAAGQLLVLDQGDVGLDAGRVAVHHERDRPCRSQHRRLGVAVAVLPTRGDALVPDLGRRIPQILRAGGIDLPGRVAVHLHHPQHRLAVFGEAGEGPDVRGDLARHQVGLPRQQRGQGPADPPARVAVVGNAHRHQQAPQVGEPQAQRTVPMAVLGDRRRRVAGVVDQDLLGGDEDRGRPAVPLHIKRPIGPLELLQVQARQVARRVVEEHVLAARIAGVDRPAVRAGVPAVDGRVELHAGVAAEPRPLGNLPNEVPGVVRGTIVPGIGHPAGRPLAIAVDGVHEVVTEPNREVGVLEHDRAVRFAIEVGFVLARSDQCAGLLLFLRLALDELQHVGMPVLQALHLGGPAGLAPRLHHRGDLVVDPHERQRSRRGATPRKLLFGAADRRQVGPRPRTELEQHRLARGEPHDVLHVVLHRLNEAGGGLGVLIRGFRTLNAAGHRVPAIVPPATTHLVLVEQPHVEPHGRIEAAVLVQAQPGEFAVKVFAVGGSGEVAILCPPVSDCPRDAVNHLPDAVLALFRPGFAIEVLRDHDVGRQRTPGGGNLAVFLLEQDFPVLVLDLGRAEFPLAGVERIGADRTEVGRHMHRPGPVRRLTVRRDPVIHCVSLLSTHRAFLEES